MRYIKRIIGALLITTMCIGISIAQSFYNFSGRNVIVSAGTGTTSYFGDLNNPKDYFDTKLNLNFGLQYYFNERIAGRAELTWFQLKGSDSEANEAGRMNRNLSFVSNNMEIDFVGIVNAFPNGSKFYQRPAINVYGFAGLGVLYFNPKAELNGQMYALQPLKTEGVSYSRVAIAIPFGGGIKFKAGPFVNLTAEIGHRLAFTDYLDDVSTDHVDNTSFTDPIAAALADRRPELGLAVKPAGTQRGSSEQNDAYLILNFKIEYYLPSTILGKGGKSKYKRRKPPKRKRTKFLGG